MDVSVIDINTWERSGAPATDKTQSAPIRGAISVPASHVRVLLHPSDNVSADGY